MRSVRERIRSVAPLSARLLACGVALASCVAAAQSAPEPPEVGQSPARSSPEKQGPRIEMGQLEVDLGELVKGETAEARFAIHNRGDETLRILRAKPG